jgi:MFS family permease
MSSVEQINRPSVLAVSTCFIGVAYLVYNMLPIILKSAGDSMGLTGQQLGYLGSVYMAGSAISNVVAVFWVRKLNWKTTVFVTSLLACMGFMASAFSDYQRLLVLFFMSGLASAAIVSCVYTCMGDTKNPNRAFGYGIGVQVVLAGVCSIAVPLYIIPSWGFQGVVFFLAVMVFITLPLVLWLPRSGAAPTVPASTTTGNTSPSGVKPANNMLWGFAGLFIYFVGQSGIWAFFGRIGGDQGLSDQQLGSIFGITLILSAAGGFMAGWFSTRFDRRLLIACSIAVGVVSLVILILPIGADFWMFSLAVLLYSLSWNFVMPFFMTVITEGDVNGRFTPLIPACQLFGSVVGPAVAGNMIVGGSYLYVYLFAIVSVLVCLMIFVCIDTFGWQKIETNSDSLVAEI